jgi:hypothetical protein
VARSDCRRSHISVARGSSLRQSAISCSGPDSSVYRSISSIVGARCRGEDEGDPECMSRSSGM